MNLLDLLFPKRCVGCSELGLYFCQDCIKDIKQTELVCPFCERNSIGGAVHPVCIRKFGLDGLWSLGVYEAPLKNAISKLKYRWVRELAASLVDILIDYFARRQPLFLDQIKKDRGKNWIITGVPLHWTRKNWRGFNQAELLAKLISKKIGLEYQDLLKRVKNTRPQVGQEASKRRENIKGAFLLPVPSTLPPNILLIDDVWTTGATLKECCYILKKGGAKKVWALTLAR